MSDLVTWRKKGQHLPYFLRDFHDAKLLFKTIEHKYKIGARNNHYDIDFATAQVYVLDSFLWFMAAHGYTLQKSRKQVAFYDLAKTLETFHTMEMEAFCELMNARR